MTLRVLPNFTSSQPIAVSNQRHMPHPTYRADIDGLRAIAVLFVVGFHAFPDQVPGGFVGVDVFFVISGFLISTIIFGGLENDSFTYWGFYVRRIRRICPSLVLVLSATAIFGWYELLADEYEQLGKHIAAGVGFVSNFAFWSEVGYFDNAAETKPLLHLWSLGLEEQFYLIWPVLLSLAWKRRLNFLLITTAIAIVSFGTNIYLARTNAAAAFYSPATRFWELMLGGMLAYVSLHRPNYLPKTSNWQSAIGLALIALTGLFINQRHSLPGLWALLPTVGTVLMISAGPESWLNRTLLSNRLFVTIGVISYPLYLWHWPLLSFGQILHGGMPPIAIRIKLVTLAVILATFTYLLIEKPIRFRLKSSAATYLLVVAMAIIGSGGMLIFLKDGFMGRMINNNPAGFEFGLKDDYQVYRCFLNEDASDLRQHISTFKRGLPFPELCAGTQEIGENKPLVLIWGDSHANSIALGLSALSEISGFTLAVYTSSGCPPVNDFVVEARKDCAETNQFVSSKIKELKPKAVILSAFWGLYNGYDNFNQLDYGKLSETIQLLRSENVENIVIFGNLPTFKVAQPRIAVETFVSGKVDRTTYKYDGNVGIYALENENIRRFAADNNVTFVSPTDLLCNNDGCLISTSKSVLIPLAWDYGHLTKSGSIYLINEALKANKLALP